VNVLLYWLPLCKKHNFRKILTFGGGLLYRPTFTAESEIWCAIADPRYTLTCQLSSRSVYSVALWRRKTQNFVAFGLRPFVVSPIGSNLRKLNTGVMDNYKPSPIQRYQNRFCTSAPSWRNRVHKLWHSRAWRTDKQTDKKLNVFCCPSGWWNPSPTKLGTVIEDLEHVLAPIELLGIRHIVLSLGGAENLGEPEPSTWNPLSP